MVDSIKNKKEHFFADNAMPLILGFVLIAVVNFIDFFTPLDFAAGSLYVPIILLSMLASNRYAAIYLALFSTACIVLGYFTSPSAPDGMGNIPLINRVVSLCVLWVTAYLVLVFKSLELKLIKQNKEFSDQKNAINAHAIVSTTDVKGNINYVNEKFCDVSGYSREEIMGLNHRILKSDEHSKEFYRDLWKTMAQGKAWHGELKNFKKDGGVYWVYATIIPLLNDAGKPYQYMSIRTDISKRKLAELTALDHQREAERANQAKSEFLSSMSHELRTPMNSVLGFCQILSMNKREPLTDNQRASVDYIMSSGQYLLTLIDGVLDLSKIESGHMSVLIETVRLDDLCRECLSLISGQEDQMGLTINFEVSDVKFIKADVIRFKQVLLNLLSNAIKYNKQGGSVTLSYNKSADHMVRISVVDTGDGIDEHRQAELFKPFNRLGRETSAIAGTGIGLTISKKLVESMGGVIGFDSLVDKGTTFWVDMPEAKEQSSQMVAEDNCQRVDDSSVLHTAEATVLYTEDKLGN